MRIGKGRITEIIAGFDDCISLRIDCSEGMIPAPGEYLLAYMQGDADSVLAVPLFRVDASPHATLQTTSSAPATWVPGTTLNLRGPLGRGFKVPSDTRHLALAALGGTISRLLPLIRPALEAGADIALFTRSTLALSSVEGLPAAVEIHPLSALPEALPWADFLALDLPVEMLPALRRTLGIDLYEPPACTVQALILTPMPCGAIADCGVCAAPARKGYKLACKDGPVFDLNQLKW